MKYFGENRVQAFLEKYEHYHGNGEFHFIGTLQTNKVMQGTQMSVVDEN